MASPTLSSAESSPSDADTLVEPAIELVERWLVRAVELESKSDRATMRQLRDLVTDTHGVSFVMRFIDRVARPDSKRVAAKQLQLLVQTAALPEFLSPIDRVLLRAGGLLAPLIPQIVMPLADRRMRSIVGHLVAPAEPAALGKHLRKQQSDGYDVNVNLLGEAVLGEREAQTRLHDLVRALDVPEVDYVSVKLSAVASQINHWAYEASLERVTERLDVLLTAAAARTTPAFINFDMEEYHDLEMTVAAFKAVLGRSDRLNIDAGIVLQAYLPDAFAILQDLVEWANKRHMAGGGTIKIRLVKGANLAMEMVDADIHGWEQAPFGSKLESDASFRRCVDWALDADNLRGVRIGLASHNLFDVAWALLLAQERGVEPMVQFEMLQGMASGQAKAVNESVSKRAHPAMLLYTPAVEDGNFDVAIGYLFRRLEENAAEDNFMRALFDLNPGSATFKRQADFFREGTRLRNKLDYAPRRTQNRLLPPVVPAIDAAFRNEPDTDPCLAPNRQWIKELSERGPSPCQAPIIESAEAIDVVMAKAEKAAAKWRTVPAAERRRILHRAADELAARRSDMIVTMMHEASKTIAEADSEISEAIDFARWYGDRAVELDSIDGVRFEPLGVIAVIPPWNFPTAIPAGGIMAALAAGNAAVLKPAPQTPRCAELVAKACWAAGVPVDAIQFVRAPDNEAGQRLVESADAVILTGSSETAEMFRSWKPELRLFAETSGKNALIITPRADLDLAVADLVRSAFGHAGQKCSAASLAILVGDVATSERFKRQLVDAVESLTVGSSLDLNTDVATQVGVVNDRLLRAATILEPGESWLVAPTVGVDGTVSPGVRDGVISGSWFHRTECFGPVLGLMAARDLDEAIQIANSSDFGLTGGIHSLDPSEVQQWSERIEVGNGYVNRAITGAIVQRQPFGGWKRSSVGPGAKAGGPNYLMQLGHWVSVSESDDFVDDYAEQWESHFSQDHDETGLFCEANVFRYRPYPVVGIRIEAGASDAEVRLAKKAASIVGASVHVSVAKREGGVDWLAKANAAGVAVVRVVGGAPTGEQLICAAALGIHLAACPVTLAGRVELQHYVREQAISQTLHRFGNLTGQQPFSSGSQPKA